MAYGLVADEGSVFIEKEVTEGTYVAESAASSAVEVLADGLEFTPTKELLERNNRTSTVEKVSGRVGQKSMAGSVPVELKAGSTEGSVPETDALYESLLGGKRTYDGRTTSIAHTSSVLNFSAGDAAQYAVGDIIKVKEYDLSSANPDHVSPIIDITGDAVTLLVPYHQAFTDNVTIAAGVTYYHASGAPTLSITNYLGGEIREKAIGMRCVSGEISNFATGQLASTAFSVEGLDFDRAVGAPLYTPAYDTSLPPVILNAKVYKDGSEITVNSVGISMSNTLGFLTSTASASGKISSRITEFVTTFNINPYMEDDDVDNFNLFNDNTSFSLFGSAHNAGAAANQKLENVAFYMPTCKIPEIATAEEDGILTDAISGQAYKSTGNDTVFISFI